MTSSTAPPEIPIANDLKNLLSCLEKSCPVFDEATLTQSTKILSDEITLYTPNRLTSRLLQIKFYNSDDSLSLTKEISLTPMIELEDLTLKLQGFLNKSLSAGNREISLVDSVQISILTEPRQSFPWLKTSIENTNEDTDDLSERLTCNSMKEKMNLFWACFRDLLLIDDHEITKNYGFPVLKVKTVLSTNKLKCSRGGILTDDSHILDAKLKDISSPVNENGVLVKRTPAIFERSAPENPGTDCETQRNWIPQSITDHTMKSQRQETENGSKIKEAEKTVNDDISIKYEAPNRDNKKFNDSENQRNEENSPSDLFLGQFFDLKEQWEKCSQTGNPFTIYSNKDLGIQEGLDVENNIHSLFSMIHPNHMDEISAYWNGYDYHIDGSLSAKIAAPNYKDSFYRGAEIDSVDTRLMKDLEKYRKMHESAISYADEDEEAFFPPTPNPDKTIGTSVREEPNLNGKRQMTQLDLDKIVKDALTRKMNKLKSAHQYPSLASPNLNWCDGMTDNRLGAIGNNFDPNLNIFLEHDKVLPPEKIYPYGFCDSGESMFGNSRQHFPAYYNIGHPDQIYETMSHIDPELIPLVTLSSPNNDNIDTLEFMSQNLHNIDNAMMIQPANNLNMVNFLDNTQRCYSGPKDIRHQFTGYDCRFAADNNNAYFAHTLSSQNYMENALM